MIRGADPPPSASGIARSEDEIMKAKKEPWISPNRVRFWNYVAFAMHFVLAVAAFVSFFASNVNPSIFELKVDRLQVVPRLDLFNSSLVAHSVLQLHAPFSNQVVSSDGVSFNEQCDIASRNKLKFRNSNSSTGWVELDTYTVPKKSGMFVDPRQCVFWFFILSFLFQGAVELFTLFSNEKNKFFAGFNWKNILWVKNVYVGMDVYQGGERAEAFACILHCNWLRFVEYSASGSLVLFTIAVFAGIYDGDLLILIFISAAVCMILGIVCEFCLRVHDVFVYMMQKELASFMGDGTAWKKLIVDMQWKIWYSAVISHLLGWLCIIVPWIIIIVRYYSWWNPCNAIFDKDSGIPRQYTLGSDDASARRNPPDFVLAIIVVEVVLYASFGLVQAIQLFKPRWLTNNSIELTYIFLSIVAKGFVGIFLFANVLFTT